MSAPSKRSKDPLAVGKLVKFHALLQYSTALRSATGGVPVAATHAPLPALFFNAPFPGEVTEEEAVAQAPPVIVLPVILLSLLVVVADNLSEAERSCPSSTLSSIRARGSRGRELRQASHLARQAEFNKVHTSQAQRIDFFLDCESATFFVAPNVVAAAMEVTVPASVDLPLENFCRLRLAFLLLPKLPENFERGNLSEASFTLIEEKSDLRADSRVRLSET